MKIKKVAFGTIPFRMFCNIEFDIAERITVIAGHNGIGKSTLLGLIANGSELKKNQGETLFHKAFQAQLHELFYLDKEKDYVLKRVNKPSFTLTYSCKGKADLVKTCNVSEHKEQKGTAIQQRLKVVPRGTQVDWEVGPSAKVIIPTLFLSMSRMLPIGEHQRSLSAELSKRLSDDDRYYIKEKFKSIIDNKIVESNNITKHELKGTTKRSLLPEFEHSTRTISLGQDSLSSIITAFASFNKLKREQGEDYNGGILLIDEIDAGFHPRAQIKLIKLIKEEAKKLHLQVILTSHSLTIIQEVLKISDETARVGRNIDSVIYIEDVLNPKLMVNPTYTNIKNDMLGILPEIHQELPKMKIYFEDEEAKWIFEKIVIYEEFDIKVSYNHEFIFVAAKLGCDNLKSLFKVDDYFKSVVIVFDNDVLTKEATKKVVNENNNIIALPAILGEDNVEAEKRTPEYQIYNYIKILLANKSHPFWDSIPNGYNMEMIKDTMVDSFPLSTTDKPLRELRKDWFKKHQAYFENIDLMTFFCMDNQDIIMPFMNDLKTALDSLIK
jgi:ABC-type Mn2+/Zn2+ transport system ATPase subunit